jgi:transcriptional regulator with XRE-family HTH domain
VAGRHEKPLDNTVPERTELARFLRNRKTEAGLTYEQMAQRTEGAPSKVTFARAASGTSVPSWGTVHAFVVATVTQEEAFGASPVMALNHARELLIRARRATRADRYVYKMPDPTLVSDLADLSRALRDLHAWAGSPAPGEMERMAGPGELPRSTLRRIIRGEALPVDPAQAIAFLKACYVSTFADLEPWLHAAVRALSYDRKMSLRELRRWDKVHQDVRAEVAAGRREEEEQAS